MKSISFLVLAALIYSPPANSQQSSTKFTFRCVLRPDTTISGQTFGRNTTIHAAVINDAEEVAFVAEEPRDANGVPRTFVFTLHRLVSNGEGVIDGKHLLLILDDGRLAISAAGLVAYQAFYDLGDAPGIFVEQHYVLTPADEPDFFGDDFTVDDSGNVRPILPSSSPCTATSPDNRKTLRTLPNLIPIAPPRLPKPSRKTAGSQQPASVADSRASTDCSPFSTLSRNSRGQVVIPVNTRDGAYLFIATPAKH
jgi:hypothetical protein